LLRIEDTDRARSTPEATQAILDGLRWLGLDWDGEAISQFARAERHRAVAEAMVARGTAFRCYATREEIEAAREQARADKRPLGFHSPMARRGPAPPRQICRYVIRLKAPREGSTSVHDAVQGNRDLEQ
jgi:glutamyl-tRNA synthetase